MPEHHRIDYVELPSGDLAATKRFFREVFGMAFTDYGPGYTAFDRGTAGIDGGFFRSAQVASTAQGSALIVLYSEAIEQTLARVEAAGGVVTKPIFSFPGGRRFHFVEPGGSELAVWGA